MWEQQSVLARLGTSEEAAKVRAKMQSTSLLSDMQAFKVSRGEKGVSPLFVSLYNGIYIGCNHVLNFH